MRQETKCATSIVQEDASPAGIATPTWVISQLTPPRTNLELSLSEGPLSKTLGAPPVSYACYYACLVRVLLLPLRLEQQRLGAKYCRAFFASSDFYMPLDNRLDPESI